MHVVCMCVCGEGGILGWKWVHLMKYVLPTIKIWYLSVVPKTGLYSFPVMFLFVTGNTLFETGP